MRRLTTFRCVYPKKQDLFNEFNVDIFFAYLFTDTARAIFADNGREYGDGLQKFESNDINNAKMPDLTLLSAKDGKKIFFLYDKIKNNTKKYNDDYFVKEIDKILNGNFMVKCYQRVKEKFKYRKRTRSKYNSEWYFNNVQMLFKIYRQLCRFFKMLRKRFN